VCHTIQVPSIDILSSAKCPRGKGLLLNILIPRPRAENGRVLDGPRCLQCELFDVLNPPMVVFIPRKDFGGGLKIACNGRTTHVDLTPPKPTSRISLAVLPRGPFLGREAYRHR